MKKYIFLIFFFSLLSSLFSVENVAMKAKALYHSLNPLSVAQHLALYELYPESEAGQWALNHAWHLLSGDTTASPEDFNALPEIASAIDAVISLVNKQQDATAPLLEESQLSVIEKVAVRLPNRTLKGHATMREDEIIQLPFEEIDLARALFLTELEGEENVEQKVRSYEALIDLMALQILARVPEDATPETKIRMINTFIFEEMGFRFPPHSQMAKDIDLYTFLPSVLDSRQGVCLGVSILYLCLAQRLHLTLETITPPGHIYVRYREGDHIVNIETTARGVDLDSKVYLGLETRSLELRNIKEVVGLAHMNQAGVHWHRGDHQKALNSYHKAQRYLPDDMLLKQFMALNYLFVGETEKGEALMHEVRDYVPDYAITKQTFIEDYLNKHIDAEGLKPAFMEVDETRESILKKRDALVQILEKYPRFRFGLFTLGTTWLQLHRHDEALKAFERLHQLDSSESSVEYFLSALYAERLDYNNAWKHLILAESIVHARDHHPEALKDLRRELEQLCPH